MASNPVIRRTDADVAAFLAGVDNAERRADAHTLVALMTEVTSEPPERSVQAVRGVDRQSRQPGQ